MSDHDYHALSDREDTSDSLWDQLNDQESREVQQHQSRFQAADPYSSRTNHWVILQSMAWNTVERTGSAATSAWQAAQDSWKKHPYRTGSRTPTTDEDFDVQFGIQDLRHPDYTIHEEDDNGSPHGSESSQEGRGSRRRRRPQEEQAKEPRPNPGYPFVVLHQYPSRQAISRAKDHWGIVGNMDVFLTNLYQYYYHRGMLPLVCKFLVELLSLLFTLWLSRILLLNVDWNELVTCHDENTCHDNWSDYYRTKPLSKDRWWLVQGYTLLVLGYAIFSTWSFWQSLKQAWTCQFIMHEKLGISARKLQGGAVAWDAVVEKLMHVQDSGDYKLALTSLDPLLIAQRIMRKENFLIAFWNQNLLDVKIGNRHYWCPGLEWCVHSCILNFMFNHKYEIRPAFLLDSTSLQWRLQVCGLVHAFLLPFLIVFVILHFLFRNVYDFKTTKQYMGNKQWSTVAQWNFREFNELPHVFERRLEPSYEASENYLKLFGTSEWMAALGKLLVFLGSATGFVLLVLGLLNDAILLHVQLWGRNLLWYAGISGIVYSIGKALLPGKEAQPSVSKNLFEDMDTALKTVSSHTHYYPEHWKGRGWDSKVHSQFGMFFDSKVKLFLWELISLVLAPYLLIVKLPSCAPAICEFCMMVKAKVPGAGDVCGYSTFDFDTFKDEAWEGKTLGASMMVSNDEEAKTPETNETVDSNESLEESVMRTGNIEEAINLRPKPRAREGKMEKSFFNFKNCHPDWKCSPSGQTLMDRVEEYRQAELAAMSRERELHIEAAARQLETLAWLEEERRQQRSPAIHRFHRERVQETHVAHEALPRNAQEGPFQPPMLPSLHTNGNHKAIPGKSNAGPETAIRKTSSASSSPGFPFASNGVDHGAHEAAPATPLHHPALGPVPGAFNGNAHLTPGLTPVMYLPSNTVQDDSTPGSLPTPGSTASGLGLTGHTLGASNRDALRAGLSTELRKLLTMSTLEPGESVLGTSSLAATDAHMSSLGAPTSSTLLQNLPPDRKAERQYYWLERFHEHLESQERQEQEHQQQTTTTAEASDLQGASTTSEPIFNRPASTTRSGDQNDNMPASNIV